LVCVMEPWRGMGSLHSALLAVSGGVCWALGPVLTKRMFQLHAPAPIAFTPRQMLSGATPLGTVPPLRPAGPIAWTPAFVAGLAYSVVLASSVAWLLWSFVVDRLPTAVASLSSLAVPVTAVLMAWAILHERPDGMETTGIVLIVLGLLAVSGI